ncbi:MAG TPA: hypothetical protein VGR35_08100 [Tepidisphaeraceae bacterium]|nr:hypothetical protein [Tepidisphaeraceae bacterium]
MQWRLAMLSTVLLSGCSGPPSPTYTTAPPLGGLLSRTPSLQKILPVAGKVPIAELIYHLRKMEVVSRLPPSGLISGIPVEFIQSEGQTSAADAIRAVEEATGWVFDVEAGVFYEARASHSIDSPDAFGRPGTPTRAPLDARPMVQMAVRFRRVSAAVTPDALGIGGDGTVFTASVPDGVMSNWSRTSSRTYFEGIQDANAANATVVRLELREKESGLQVGALAARLPGGMFRLDGRISVSSFTGRKGTDRDVIDFPLQIDGERGRWCRVVVIKGADVGASLAFRQFDIDPAGSGEAIEVCVRVD